MEANLPAEVHWKIYKHASFNSGERFIRITSTPGSPFKVETSYADSKATSTLTVNHIGLCMNDTEIACYASNNVQKTTQLHTFETRRGWHCSVLFYIFQRTCYITEQYYVKLLMLFAVEMLISNVNF